MMMRAKLCRTVVVMCGLGAAAASGLAGPLQRADVAAEPAWVLHLDCDGLRPTAIGQYLLAEMEKPEAQAKLATLKAIANLDLRKQLHGLTLYGAGNKPADGVLLVYADCDPDRLVTLAKSAKDYQTTTFKTHPIHSWLEDEKKSKGGVKPRVYAAIHGRRVVIFGQQEPRVAQALDVLDRGTANLSGSTLFAELGAGGGGGFLQAAARKLDLAEGDANTALLRLAKSARLDVGEAQGQLRATLKLEAGDQEVARQMVSIGQGLLALMKLQKDNPGSVKVAEAFALKQQGAGMEATLAIPAAEAIALMRANAEAKANKRGAR